MNGPPRGLGPAVAHALAAPAGETLAGVVRVPAVTAILADPRDAEALERALPVVLDAMDRAGVPRGRAFVLLAASVPAADARAVARALRGAIGLPVLVHDPVHSAHFTAGRTPQGTPLELDDELREAEAVLALAEATRSPAALVLPGLASAAAAAAHEALPAPGARAQDARDAMLALGLDYGVTWRVDTDRVRAWAAPGIGAWVAAHAAVAS